MTNENRLPMPGLECLWHEGEEVATLKSASAIIKWGDRGWVLRQAFQDECDALRARVAEMEAQVAERAKDKNVNPWNEVDPKGPVSCIPKPGGSTQVSLPGETPFACTIRWKDRAEVAEARVTELEGLLRRALCHPLGDLLEADIISALNLQPKG